MGGETMILGTKGRYAVMAMVDLANRNSEKPVTLADIAEAQEIPLAYLEQIFAKLKKQKLVVSIKGPGGGYKLAKKASETFIADIMMAAEESIKMTRCNAKAEDGCMSAKARCLTHDLWDGLGEEIYQYLNNISLEDVCQQRMCKASQATELAISPDAFMAG
jgi:Rrf2 family iron-sulfur cluster assembly transcriptional regulator